MKLERVPNANMFNYIAYPVTQALLSSLCASSQVPVRARLLSKLSQKSQKVSKLQSDKLCRNCLDRRGQFQLNIRLDNQPTSEKYISFAGNRASNQIGPCRVMVTYYALILPAAEAVAALRVALSDLRSPSACMSSRRAKA